MAKKIVVSEVKGASNALKDFQIEHIVVSYPNRDRKGAVIGEKRWIIVKNVNAQETKDVLKEAGISILKIKGARRFEKMAAKHTHFRPQFECTCRRCGKKFMSFVKEAAWCSKECKRMFRKEKKCGSQDNA